MSGRPTPPSLPEGEWRGVLSGRPTPPSLPEGEWRGAESVLSGRAPRSVNPGAPLPSRNRGVSTRKYVCMRSMRNTRSARVFSPMAADAEPLYARRPPMLEPTAYTPGPLGYYLRLWCTHCRPTSAADVAWAQVAVEAKIWHGSTVALHSATGAARQSRTAGPPRLCGPDVGQPHSHEAFRI